MTRNRYYSALRILPALLVGLITIVIQLDSPDQLLLATAPLDKSVERPNQPSLIRVTLPPTLPRDFYFSLPLFTADSAWNQTVTQAEILPESDEQILVTYRVLRGDTTDLHPTGEPPPTTWPFPDVGYDEWTIPVYRAGAGETSVSICDSAPPTNRAGSG